MEGGRTLCQKRTEASNYKPKHNSRSFSLRNNIREDSKEEELVFQGILISADNRIVTEGTRKVKDKHKKVKASYLTLAHAPDPGSDRTEG
jgi:hypothetical protein